MRVPSYTCEECKLEKVEGEWCAGHDACRCGRLKVGGRPTGSRDWNPDCPEHGTKSEWYRSPEQVAKREADSERLRDLYRRAREARAAGRGPGR